jgi:lipopolysaccharide exporter
LAVSASTESLGGAVRRGLVWSTLNAAGLRAGSLVVGIVLARLLAPEDFGVYAIALTVQTVLMTLADLGMSADLVRAKDPERRAPTVATVSLGFSIVLALIMTVTAGPTAAALGSADAAGVIMVLSLTVVIAGAGVVPYAHLQREFEQRKLFAATAAEFGVGTCTTVGLILLGMGPMALAIGRVVAQVVATTLQFVLARTRPRFGFAPSVASSALAYGVPLALANLLSFALLSIDNVVIARVAGVTALGFYVLAFNISTWPISAISQSIRGVSLAGFSRASREGKEDSLAMALSLTWTAGLLAGVMLAALAHPLVAFLYGERWNDSAAVLAALGFFGGLRVALDLLATYLMARGASRPVLYIQLLWFVALIPTVIVAIHWHGVAGAAWAHLVVGALIVLPAYAVALARLGTSPRVLVQSLWLPLLASVPTWWVAHTLAGAIDNSFLALLAGGVAGCLTYGAITYRRVRQLLGRDKQQQAPAAARIDKPSLEPAT